MRRYTCEECDLLCFGVMAGLIVFSGLIEKWSGHALPPFLCVEGVHELNGAACY